MYLATKNKQFILQEWGDQITQLLKHHHPTITVTVPTQSMTKLVDKLCLNSFF